MICGQLKRGLLSVLCVICVYTDLATGLLERAKWRWPAQPGLYIVSEGDKN